MKVDRIAIPAGAIRIPLPDATQVEDYSCGASCLQSICKYYGVGWERGLADEWDFVAALGMDKRVGSHAFQLIKLARRLGLTARPYDPMTQDEIKRELDRRHPVMLMIQAWGSDDKSPTGWIRDYSSLWSEGHWVVAIGYDRHGFFFEDPSLQMVRGFLTYEELATRWRDTGPRGVHVPNYGVAIWHPRRTASAYTRWAEPIR